MESIQDCALLVVDDEPELLKMVVDLLKREGFSRVDTAATCRQALEGFEKGKPDCVLLDVMLPDGDGFSLMRALRARSAVPVLFLSARGEDEDRLLGLGADDYITKPFLPRELLLRLRAVLGRTYFPAGRGREGRPRFRLGDRVVDLGSGTVEGPQGAVSLTAKEYALIKKLYENRGSIVTVDNLCRAAWGDSLFGYENTLMVHIRRLREKIEPVPSAPRYLLTVRGLGYKLAKEGGA